MKQSTLDLLACPVCHGPLEADAAHRRVICRKDNVAFEIREGILRMLPGEAVSLNEAGSRKK